MKRTSHTFKTIIWDWNGTLLNDVDICIECMNTLLEVRKLPLLNHQKYLDIFTFPVREYYISAGFDLHKEDFDIPAHQFIDLYRQQVMRAPLHEDVANVIGELARRGYEQAILSAMERDLLLQTLGDKGIIPLFNRIFGIDNHLGAGKSLAAAELMHTLNCSADDVLIIGDTLHDAEIAGELGTACILVSQGHQSRARLEATGYPVIPRLRDLLEIL